MRRTFVPAVIVPALALLALLDAPGVARAGTPLADLRVTMTDNVLRVEPGQVLTYELTVFNAGPDAAPDSIVGTFFPPSFVPGAWTCTGFSGATCGAASGTGVIDTTATLPVGSLVVFSAAATVAPGASGLITARTGAFPPSGVTDPDLQSNNAADTDNVSLDVAELAHGFDETRSLDGVTEHFFRISQEPLASYEVVVDATSGDIGGGSGPTLERLASDGTLPLQTGVPVGAGPSRSLRWRTQSGGAQVQDQFIRVRSADCSPCGPDDVYRIRAYDTSYTLTRFNNSATQVTVLLLQNTTTETVTGTIYFWVPSGGAIATFGFNLPARQTLVLNTAAVASNQAGTLTISNTAPYGTLVGKTVALEPAAGFSFDTPLLPRPR